MAGPVLPPREWLLLGVRHSGVWSIRADLEEFRNYLEKRFDFEQVTVKKFRTWAERRQFNREMKRKQAESERPILPANQKLITLSVQDAPTKKGEPGPTRPAARACPEPAPAGGGPGCSEKGPVAPRRVRHQPQRQVRGVHPARVHAARAQGPARLRLLRVR